LSEADRLVMIMMMAIILIIVIIIIIMMVVKWAELRQLKIAINKCFTLNIGKIPSCVYRIDDFILPSVASCRDLGINVSCDLSTREHVNAFVLKAHQRANMILKRFISKDINVLLRAYYTYVRPISEYNSVVWSPILKCELDALEHARAAPLYKTTPRN